MAGAGVLYYAFQAVEMSEEAEDQRLSRKQRQDCSSIITNSLTRQIFIKYRALINASAPYLLWEAIKNSKGTVVQGGVSLTNLKTEYLSEE